MNAKYASEKKTLVKATKNEITNAVGTARRQQNSSDWWSKLSEIQWACVGGGDKRLFLKYKFEYELIAAVGQMSGRLYRMPVWAHPDLLPVLRRRAIPIYIDATFGCVPRPFRQCVILMAYDDESGKYVPVIFGLIEEKTEWGYWHFLHYALVATETKLKSSTVRTDFEWGLINACHEQFPDATHIGCFFHFKQALRRRLEKKNFSKENISKIMAPGIIDRLAITPKEQVMEGIKELCKLMEESDSEKLDKFYGYFEKQWMGDFLMFGI